MVRTGRLAPPTSAPDHGEDAIELCGSPAVSVSHILSGRLPAPIAYDQDTDELAVVLGGRAVVDVGGERLEMAAGDWVWLPAHTPHTLVHTDPATSWLTIHAKPAG